MPTDTERLFWYARYVAETGEGLGRRTQPDRVMGVTAFGQVTSHELWHWPFDTSNREFADLREAIDSKMRAA